ncbi:MAG: HAMP domain-containing histidine kinase [Lachnospiraceae bacterium]|nr:HAMP domain-containing histidine kinase [Lachnospiraceae bacterium]
MKRRFMSISIGFSLIMILIAGVFYIQSRRQSLEDLRSQQIVAVNELEQLALQGELEELRAQSSKLQDSLRASETNSEGNIEYLILGGIGVLYIAIVFAYLYFAVLRPFDKMKNFAKDVAQGNLEVPLDYERSNYFGDFTWAFESMRREILKSRSCEKEAIENNKTVIATLSHDIKTPVASIRAYAEGLEANMDRSVEKRAKYLHVIMKKCDEVAALTNDLFLHSISDMEKLKVEAERFELCGFLENAIGEISAEHEDVTLVLPESEIFVLADRNRLMQVCENLINNARKYAKTNIDISIAVQDTFARICFRDYGGGIPDEDMPFIFSKFYRGKNCGNEQGSGLGLYIVKYITQKQGGTVELRNHPDGLEAVVSVPVAES